MMNIPNGDPPAGGFPVIILNHGYFNQGSFQSGDGTHAMADILADKGYITLASDYRGFGKSEDEGQDHNFKNLGWDKISSRTIAFFDKYLKEEKI